MLAPPSPTLLQHNHHHGFMAMRPSMAVPSEAFTLPSRSFPITRIKPFSGSTHVQERRPQDELRQLHTPWQAARRSRPSHEAYHPYRMSHGLKRSPQEMEEIDEPTESTQHPLRLPTIEALRSQPVRPMPMARPSHDHPSGLVSQSHGSVSAVLTRGDDRQGSPFNKSREQLTPLVSSPGSPPLKRRVSPSPGSDDGSSSPVPLDTEPSKGKKRQRYLRDVDRRSIILRIENGEKQASLAREFGVTRAAICHIKKNRDEIISRYDSLLKSAQEMERAGVTVSGSPRSDEPPMVQELSRQSVAMLLTTLRDGTTPSRAFRLAANRLIMILLEEALAGVAAVSCEVAMPNGEIVLGVKPDPKMCCVAVGQKGLPLLRLYHQIEPSRAVGCVHLRSGRRGSCTEVERLDLPRDVGPDSSVLLFSSTSATGESLCSALEALVEIGVSEDRIRVVLLACTSATIEHVCGQFPGVRVLAAVIETATPDYGTTLGNFLTRYNDVKLEPRELSPSSAALAARRQYEHHSVIKAANDRLRSPPRPVGTSSSSRDSVAAGRLVYPQPR